MTILLGLAGFACVIAAAALLSPALGLAVIGVGLLYFAWVNQPTEEE